MGLRTQISRATSYSLFFLVYESEAVLPADLIWTSTDQQLQSTRNRSNSIDGVDRRASENHSSTNSSPKAATTRNGGSITKTEHSTEPESYRESVSVLKFEADTRSQSPISSSFPPAKLTCSTAKDHNHYTIMLSGVAATRSFCTAQGREQVDKTQQGEQSIKLRC